MSTRTREKGRTSTSSMALCVPTYTDHSHREQPLLRAEKAVLDNIDASIARNPYLGTRYSPAAEE